METKMDATMDTNYSMRKAMNSDADFLADVIIGAEKSMTANLGLATVFELTEEKIKN
jgi:hypothetical protein